MKSLLDVTMGLAMQLVERRLWPECRVDRADSGRIHLQRPGLSLSSMSMGRRPLFVVEPEWLHGVTRSVLMRKERWGPVRLLVLSSPVLPAH